MTILSVIVPCFNEQDNVLESAERIQKVFRQMGVEAEIVFVNDASQDRTGELLEGLRSANKNVKVVTHTKNLGIVDSWHSGLRSCQGSYVVTIDADLQYQPEDIALLFTELRGKNVDLVQGCRKYKSDNKFMRSFLSKGLNVMLNVIFLKNLRDFKSGFVIYKRQAFESILAEKDRYRLFQHFFMLIASKKKFTYSQVTVSFLPRKKGESFIKRPFFFALAVLSEIPKVFFDYWFNGKEAACAE